MDVIYIKVLSKSRGEYYGSECVGVQPTIRKMRAGDVILFPYDYKEAVWMARSFLTLKESRDLTANVTAYEGEKFIKVVMYD